MQAPQREAQAMITPYSSLENMDQHSRDERLAESLKKALPHP